MYYEYLNDMWKFNVNFIKNKCLLLSLSLGKQPIMISQCRLTADLDLKLTSKYIAHCTVQPYKKHFQKRIEQTVYISSCKIPDI